MIWFVFVSAIFNIALALIIKTKDIPSSLIFKVVPFFLGFATLLYCLQVMKII
jgi:hypothetical protein